LRQARFIAPIDHGADLVAASGQLFARAWTYHCQHRETDFDDARESLIRTFERDKNGK
jgi:hypothetical protein